MLTTVPYNITGGNFDEMVANEMKSNERTTVPYNITGGNFDEMVTNEMKANERTTVPYNITGGNFDGVVKWFMSNDDKCHLIVANQEHIFITLGNECIETEDSLELVGITIDKNLNFNEQCRI